LKRVVIVIDTVSIIFLTSSHCLGEFRIGNSTCDLSLYTPCFMVPDKSTMPRAFNKLWTAVTGKLVQSLAQAPYSYWCGFMKISTFSHKLRWELYGDFFSIFFNPRKRFKKCPPRCLVSPFHLTFIFSIEEREPKRVISGYDSMDLCLSGILD